MLLEEGENHLVLMLSEFEAEKIDKLMKKSLIDGKAINSNDYDKIEGEFGNSFRYYFLNNNKNLKEIGVIPGGIYYEKWTYNRRGAEDELLDCYIKARNMETDEQDIKDIKFYIELPNTLPMCPILEELQKEGIEYYFMPMDQQEKNRNFTKKIYMDRKDLEKYKEKVHTKMLQQQKDITIGLESIDIGEYIVEGTNAPFIQKMKQYYSLTEQEQRKKLKEIDDSSLDIEKNYKEILQYEKEVARARDLFSQKSNIDESNFEVFTVEGNEIYDYLLSAREQGIRINIFPDVDDLRSAMIVMPKEKKMKPLNIKVKVGMNQDPSMNRVGNFKFTKSFVYITQCYLGKNNSTLVFDPKLHAYIFFGNALEEMIDKIRQEKRNETINEIKFYIEMPYLRPIVPILEKLKKAKIGYYMLPYNKEFGNKYEPTKRIYIDREDLEKYQEVVHDEISNQTNGVITIGTKDLNAVDLILGGYDKEVIR
ncbi:MAG: hypothetical protein HFJ33_00710 [Clostridia bacterium]|nr:hypothetical protein [Clostridia bacterium]